LKSIPSPISKRTEIFPTDTKEHGYFLFIRVPLYQWEAFDEGIVKSLSFAIAIVFLSMIVPPSILSGTPGTLERSMSNVLAGFALG
jgi:hypothetical protein